jgi:ribose transport system substrate-binding protein
MVGPETYDPQAEKQALLDLLNAKTPPAGIMVSSADPGMMAEAIDQALDKGINVITMDSDTPKSRRLFFIGTDNYAVGSRSAEVTAKALENAGNVIVFTIAGQANLEDRLRGYRDIFAQFPAIRIIDAVDIKGDATIAFDVTKEILAKRRSSVDAFVCLESIACAEVAEVLSRNGVRDKVVIAMDTSQRTLEWIQSGMINTTIAQRPYTMAYTGLRMLADLNKYKPAPMETRSTLATVPDFVDTGARLVTKENVDEFLKDQAAFAEAEAPAAQ